jgi:hypothetical protein
MPPDPVVETSVVALAPPALVVTEPPLEGLLWVLPSDPSVDAAL